MHYILSEAEGLSQPENVLNNGSRVLVYIKMAKKLIYNSAGLNSLL